MFARASITMLVIALGSAYAAAAEITGQVGAVDDKQVGILITGDFDPLPGDKFTVSVDIPGVGAAQVGSGVVKSLDGGIVLGEVTAATGKIAIGQQVKIDSPQAVKKAPPPPPVAAPTAPTAAPASAADGAALTTKLGLTVRSVDQATAELLDLPSASGCVVTAVAAGSPAEQAGLKKRDVLLRCVGVEIPDAARLERLIGAATGSELPLEVWRDGKKLDVRLPTPKSESPSSVPAAVASPTGGRIGLQVENYRHEVRAASVIPGSPAARVGLRRGDFVLTLDGKPVENIVQFVQSVSAAAIGQPVKIGAQRGTEKLTFDVAPEPKPTDAQWLAQMRQLAEAGDHEAEYQYGGLLMRGTGMSEPRPKDAVEWYRKSAEGGNPAGQCEYGISLINGEGVEKNPDEGAAWVKKSAAQGYSTALRVMAEMHERGLGVEKNVAESRNWWQKALDEGSARALAECGLRYLQGRTFEKNQQLGAEMVHEAANRDHTHAQYLWAWCLKNGTGVKADVHAAVPWAKKSVAGGDAASMVLLGDLYYEGRGVAQDYAEAVKLYRQAAALNNTDGQFYLGCAYCEGKGVDRDYPEGARWIKMAAEAGHVESMRQLGYMYYKGQGLAQNDEQAAAWYRKGADAGNVLCQFNLGHLYRSGRGVPKDPDEALKWFHKAADAEYAPAENMMGVIAADGEGVAKNDKTAFGWYKSAAEKGDASGQYNLGVHYYYGRGTAVNQEEGLKWLRRSADQGDQMAIDMLKQLGGQ